MSQNELARSWRHQLRNVFAQDLVPLVSKHLAQGLVGLEYRPILADDDALEGRVREAPEALLALAQRFFGLPAPVEHRVEGGGHRAELVVGAGLDPVIQIPPADPFDPRGQHPDGTDDPPIYQVSRHEAREQAGEDQGEDGHVDAADGIVGVLLGRGELLVGPRLDLLVEDAVEVGLKLQKGLQVGLERLVAGGSRRPDIPRQQALTQGRVFFVDGVDAVPDLFALPGIDQRVETGIGLFEIRTVALELLPETALTRLQVVRDVPAHTGRVDLHLEGGGTDGLLYPHHILERGVDGPLAEEDDEAGEEEEQGQAPEPQPQLARYRHGLPFGRRGTPATSVRFPRGTDPSPPTFYRRILRAGGTANHAGRPWGS